MDVSTFISSLQGPSGGTSRGSSDPVLAGFLAWLDASGARPGNTEGSRNCYKSYYRNTMKAVASGDFSGLSKNDRSGAKWFMEFLADFMGRLSTLG